MQSKVQSGYMTVSTRHGDFLFSYFLWFEDSTVSHITIVLPLENIKVQMFSKHHYSRILHVVSLNMTSVVLRLLLHWTYREIQ